MFQSSKIASGIARLQTTSASTPSSASTTAKPSPSRIRRAILRTMLESSTMRHVFISRILLSCERRMPMWLRCEVCLRHDFEHAIDVEDDHELAVETVNTAGELGHAGVEIDGVFLAAIVMEFQDLADLVDQEAVGLAARIDADRHRRLAVVVLGQPEPGAHVDHGDDAAAQIEYAGDLGRRQRH